MPIAGNCAMASDMYTPEDMTASHAVIVSTLMSAVTLPLICAVMSFVLHHLDADPLIAGVAVAQMSMPVSVNGSMMCLDVDGDVDTMARSIFLTTVLSMVTIPISSVLFMQF